MHTHFCVGERNGYWLVRKSITYEGYVRFERPFLDWEAAYAQGVFKFECQFFQSVVGSDTDPVQCGKVTVAAKSYVKGCGIKRVNDIYYFIGSCGFTDKGKGKMQVFGRSKASQDILPFHCNYCIMKSQSDIFCEVDCNKKPHLFRHSPVKIMCFNYSTHYSSGQCANSGVIDKQTVFCYDSRYIAGEKEKRL